MIHRSKSKRFMYLHLIDNALFCSDRDLFVLRYFYVLRSEELPYHTKASQDAAGGLERFLRNCPHATHRRCQLIYLDRSPSCLLPLADLNSVSPTGLATWHLYLPPSLCSPLRSNPTDPFAKTVPDHVDSELSYGVEDATVCCFDKRGTYLAVGYATGIVVIWDFVTR